MVTASLIAIGVVFEVLLLFSIADLPLYGDEPEDVYRFEHFESRKNLYNLFFITNQANRNGIDEEPQ